MTALELYNSRTRRQERFVPLEQVVTANLADLFPGLEHVVLGVALLGDEEGSALRAHHHAVPRDGQAQRGVPRQQPAPWQGSIRVPGHLDRSPLDAASKGGAIGILARGGRGVAGRFRAEGAQECAGRRCRAGPPPGAAGPACLPARRARRVLAPPRARR